jgi:hypothetical protein
MMRTHLFKNTFILLFIIGVLNFLAVYFYLYWTIWWFDMLVHFSAGACVAMAGILVYYFYKKQSLPSIRTSIVVAFAFVITIGILWEIYELLIHATALSDGLDYFLDTGSDLLMDVSGGIVGALYAHKLLIQPEIT